MKLSNSSCTGLATQIPPKGFAPRRLRIKLLRRLIERLADPLRQFHVYLSSGPLPTLAVGVTIFQLVDRIEFLLAACVVSCPASWCHGLHKSIDMIPGLFEFVNTISFDIV